MNMENVHPAEQLLMFMERIYRYGMTTTSGGNLSIMDDDGGIWITPSGIDKGSLSRDDMVYVKPDGTVIGKHTPSSELPFHRLIYEERPDIRAIVHAHPPHIMAFAVTDASFDSRTIPESYILLRGMPKLPFAGIYTDPENTARQFAPNTPLAIVSNNCVVVTGQGMLNTFDRLEVAEYSAKSILNARSLGEIRFIEDDEIEELKVAFRLED